MPQTLIDTNVLVYAYDRSELHKQRQALAVLDHLVSIGQGVRFANPFAADFEWATLGPNSATGAAQ